MWVDGVEESNNYTLDYADQEDLDDQLSRLHERLDALYDEVEYRGPTEGQSLHVGTDMHTSPRNPLNKWRNQARF